MISLKSKITQKVLSYFFLNPESELYLNEMTNKFQVNRGNLTRKLSEWKKEGILKKNKRGNLSLYKINREYTFYKELQKIFQKSFGLEANLKKILLKIKGLEMAIIFGSYANNKLRQESDIDLLLVGSHDIFDAQKEIAKLQNKIDREINIIDMTKKEYEKKKNTELIKNILKNKHIKIL